MKKSLVVLTMLLAVFAFGAAQAYAVPSIDGLVGVGEWDNVATGGPYPYYLSISDVNEVGITDNYDISNVVLLQELDAFNGDANPVNDGVYILIKTYAAPTLVDLDGGLDPWATIAMNGDFNNDGIIDIVVKHTALPNGTGQTVIVKHGPGLALSSDLVLSGGSFSMGAEGIEYFLPTGAFSTPPGVPFPGSFVGKIIYDNGGQEPDDLAVGTLVPEPSTMMLFGSGLLGMLGFIRKRFGM